MLGLLKEATVQILPQLLFLIITTIFGYISFLVKDYIKAHMSFIEEERKQVIDKIGIDKYNQDIVVAKSIVYAVEEMGRNYNWEGAVKQAKATELISQKTGLSPDEIFNVIKATVALFNANKPSVSTTSEPSNTSVQD